MPFIAPRGPASQPQKPPWVRRDSSTDQQTAEVPWRKAGQQNAQQKPTSRPNSLPQAIAVPTEPPKQGTSKLQINLKSTVKKPPAEESSFQVPEVKLQPIPSVPPTVPVAQPPLDTNVAAVNAKKKSNVKSVPIKINIEPATKAPTTEVANNNSTTVKKKPPASEPAPPSKMPAQNGVVTAKPPPAAPSAPPPPPPPPPPMAPSSGAPPPPPPPPGFAKKPPRPEVTHRLEKLKKCPRKRPDWGTMMKEIEQGKKLNHVQCNDRSKPIIPRMKSLGKFVFDSEAKPASKTDAIHNRLLTEIQGGVRLKKVQCNDRSRPVLSGLRKFRRQNTLEEMQKGSIPEETVPVEEQFELDDIDVLRDELQSAKQLLDLEVQAKIHMGKDNRDLKCQIITLEAENQTLKAQLGLIPEEELSMLTKGLDRKDSKTNLKDLRKSRSGLYKSPSIAGIKKSKSGVGDRAPKPSNDEEDLNELEEEIGTLKEDVQVAKRAAEDWEAKFKELSKQLLVAQGKLEDSEQKCVMLEKKLEKTQTQKGIVSVALGEKWTQTEEQILERRISRQMSSKSAVDESTAQNAKQFDYESGSEEEESDVEIDEATLNKQKEEREIKLWENKLKSIKEKQNSSKLERRNLKMAQKKFEEELKMAKQHHKELQKEVEKMAKMLKHTESEDGDEDNDSEKEEEEEEEDSEESEEEESESETDDEDESSSEEDDDEAGHEDRLGLFNKRVKRRENILNALRKGNYLLRANIDRLKDDLEEARIKYHDLEHELNTVLSDV